MRKNSTNFLPFIRSIGGILSYEFLFSLKSEDPKNDYVEPETFKAFGESHPVSKRELQEQIADVWEALLERWDSISLRYQKLDLSEARTKWIIPLLEGLGFVPQYNKQNVAVGDDEKLSFHLSHKGWNDTNAPYINCVSPSHELEESETEEKRETNERRHHKSPHDELQSFLNVTKGCKWGIVTNGIFFRVLRQFYHTTTKGYVEFDLENIFVSRSFSDFRLLYRVAHASRFMLYDKKSAEEKLSQTCILEEFYDQSRAAGISAGEDLRKNVKVAIESLANGFLNPELAKKMTEDENLCKNYYAEILRVIYRMIFLLFAEQRGMLPTRGSLYSEEYSMNRLLEIATQSRGKDDHTDLWEGLKVTFKLLKHGSPDPQIGVFAYNGTLFDDLETPILSELSCKNSDLCVAVRQLTSIERGNVSNRINYLDLGVEEIGSIYESLLDYTPRIATVREDVEGKTVFPNMFYLDPRGASRKTTGSYYTDRRLIDELIHSALEPVVKDRLSKASDKETALLSIKVCDPACGSGAFLIAANNFLARELARLRTPNQLEPSEKEVRRARREVLQHCIYAVDVNPMAVELAKVSLWINASVESVPLNFLDHHIKCGNSLIGATPELIERGIPSSAYNPVTNDDADVAKKMQKISLAFPDSTRLEDFMIEARSTIRSQFEELTNLSEKEVLEVEEKKKRYFHLITSEAYQNQKFIADTWTSVFFWQYKKAFIEAPMTSTIRSIEKFGKGTIDERQLNEIRNLSGKYRFFHWHLEFPEVFNGDKNGFDCMLGNPPWERIELQEKEYFETKNPEIAHVATAAKRKEVINKFRKENPTSWKNFLQAKRDSELESKFIKCSGRSPLCGKGGINTYAVFAEHFGNMISKEGFAGIIIPTGIATDETNRNFFAHLVDENKLVSIYDFENKKALFPDVHRSFKFCLLVIGSPKGFESRFSFFLHDPNELREEGRVFELSKQDFALLNPNTKTCPIFRTKHDADLTKAIYQKVPVLINERTGVNPWGIKFFAMFQMAGDSELFRDRQTLEQAGFSLSGNIFVKAEQIFLPLYEGKMLQLFDHRAASIVINPQNLFRQALPLQTSSEQHRDHLFTTIPRYWVACEEVMKRIPLGYYKDWLLGFKDITSSTNERTFIAGAIPLSAVGHTLPIMLFQNTIGSELRALLIANICTRVFDYIVRQKVGGIHLSYFIVSQLPVLPPDAYSMEVSKIVTDCTLELVYTSADMTPFAESMGYNSAPFQWSDDRRLELIAKLDAIYARLYSITKEQFDFIFESFPSTKRQEMEKYGEFKSKRLALKYFDELSSSVEPITSEKMEIVSS